MRSTARDLVSNTSSTIAVLDADGVMIDSDTDVDEAMARATRASPTGTVVVDASVYEAHVTANPVPIGKLRRSAEISAEMSQIEPVYVDWAAFDPQSDEGKGDVKDARDELRERGRELYAEMVRDAEELVQHRAASSRQRETGHRGGIAAQFNDSWLTGDFLRQNQKMSKVLPGSSLEYDSIGLSLLPHGASFREPFSTSTDQGKGGGTYCAFSSPECRKVCLVNTGQRALESGAFGAGYLFSHLMREMPAQFLANLFDRCVKAFAFAAGEGFGRFIRLNVLSDLPWELLAPGFIEAVCEYARAEAGKKRWKWTDALAFYDYTKIPYRPGLAKYYDLTYSFSGSKNTFPAIFDVIEGARGAAKRTAVVFVKRENKFLKKTGSHYRDAPGRPLSSDERFHAWTFLGEKVWNGDLSDVRPLDPEDVKIVGLTYKPPHYKVAPLVKGKQFGLLPVVPSDRLDRELPTFLVRVMQPDPDAPPIVVATQDPDNRKLVLPTWKD